MTAHLTQLARDIAARGNAHAFGIPGSGPSLDLIDALHQEGVEFIPTHFEGSAALMAGAAGRLTGTSGVCVGIKGPGLANMLPGLAACRLDTFPLVSITEAYPPGAPAHKTHKRLDHSTLAAAAAKAHALLGGSNDFYACAAQAEAEVPGPVHLDISGAEMEGPALPSPDRQTDAPLSEQVSSQLAGAQRPVIIAGSLAVRIGLHARLAALNIPVFTTAAAKGAVDETLPHAAGVYTGAGAELAPETHIIPQADLVLGIGLRHNEILNAAPFDAPLILADPAGPEVWHGLQPDHVEHAPSAAVDMLALLANVSWGVDETVNRSESLRQQLMNAGFLPAVVLDALEQRFEGKARLVLDTGEFCTIAEHVWRVRRPEGYLACAQGRYMGVSLPLAVGAALTDASMPTVMVAGDGGVAMYLAEAAIAARRQLPLMVVLMRDGYLGTIKKSAMNKGQNDGSTIAWTDSWVESFKALGFAAHRAQSMNQLQKALEALNLKSGPAFIEANFDPAPYHQMTNGLRAG